MKDQILKMLPFYRWHPEVAIRYLPIVKEIKKMGSVLILEVGSGGLGIVPYLDKQVTGVDNDFSGPNDPLLKKVQGIGEKLPFPDDCFEIVISVDTLEHVPPSNREKVISEMVRVASQEIVIATPVGKYSFEQDQELSAVYRNKFGQEFPFFKEHLEYGLPNEKEILDTLKKLIGSKGSLQVESNENLKLRKFLMTGWMTKNALVNFFHRKILLLFIPILLLFNSPPFYRKIFYAKIKK